MACGCPSRKRTGVLFCALKVKRFTETDKWKDPWFRRLTPVQKCLWVYLCDNCDHAGVLNPDWELIGFQIGSTVNEKSLEAFGDRIEYINSESLRIKAFVQFQYGRLSEDCKPHAPVFAAIKRHGLTVEGVSQSTRFRGGITSEMRARIIERDGYICVYSNEVIVPEEVEIDHVVPRSRGGDNSPGNLVVASRKMNSAKWDKDLEDFCREMRLDHASVVARISERTGKPIKGYSVPLLGRVQEEEKDKDKEKERVKDAIQVRLEALFGRRETTPWGKAELRAWGDARRIAAALMEDDWAALQKFYGFKETAAVKTYRRRDLATLLNNLAAEVAKAHAFIANPSSNHAPDQRPNSRRYEQVDDYSGIKNHGLGTKP
jgi:hypothetical protein